MELIHYQAAASFAAIVILVLINRKISRNSVRQGEFYRKNIEKERQANRLLKEGTFILSLAMAEALHSLKYYDLPKEHRAWGLIDKLSGLLRGRSVESRYLKGLDEFSLDESVVEAVSVKHKALIEEMGFMHADAWKNAVYMVAASLILEQISGFLVSGESRIEEAPITLEMIERRLEKSL